MTAVATRPQLKYLPPVEHALALLNSVIENDPTAPGSRDAKEALVKVTKHIVNLFRVDVALDLTDATDASLAVAIATTGEIRTQFQAALGRDARAGDVVSLADTADTTDDAFEAAMDTAVSFTKSFDKVTYTDTAEATLALAFATTATIPTKAGRALRVGDVIQLGGTGDTTDNAFEAAKGSAVADLDKFMVTSIVTPAVVFISNAVPKANSLYQFVTASTVKHIGFVPSFSDIDSHSVQGL